MQHFSLIKIVFLSLKKKCLSTQKSIFVRRALIDMLELVHIDAYVTVINEVGSYLELEAKTEMENRMVWLKEIYLYK